MTLEASVCSVVTRAAVRDHLAEEPEFALDLVAQVIRRARAAATETARNMALLDVYGRVVATLESYEGPARPTHQCSCARSPIRRSPAGSAHRARWSADCSRTWKGRLRGLGVKRITLLKKLPARW